MPPEGVMIPGTVYALLGHLACPYYCCLMTYLATGNNKNKNKQEKDRAATRPF